MRYLILGLLFFVIGCSGPKKRSINSNSVIDTLKLFDPNPQEGKLVEHQAVLCNCLMLDKEKIAAGIDCQKIEMQNDNELKELLQKSVANITKQKFYIVYSNTSDKRIFEIIDIVKAAKIEDYKVITLQSLFTLNVPLE
jgi:hypothetical protein